MKITQEQQTQGQKIYYELIQKAIVNTSFKEQLINSPEK